LVRHAFITVTAAVLLTAAQAGAQGVAAVPRAQGASAPDTPGTPLRARGTIAGYDGDEKVLSLSTAAGVVQFPLAAGTHVHLGSRKIEPRTLTSLTGYHAAVRYSESDGRRTARSVNVFENRERTQR
jgi:hypothetical protein